MGCPTGLLLLRSTWQNALSHSGQSAVSPQRAGCLRPAQGATKRIGEHARPPSGARRGRHSYDSCMSRPFIDLRSWLGAAFAVVAATSTAIVVSQFSTR